MLAREYWDRRHWLLWGWFLLRWGLGLRSWLGNVLFLWCSSRGIGRMLLRNHPIVMKWISWLASILWSWLACVPVIPRIEIVFAILEWSWVEIEIGQVILFSVVEGKEFSGFYFLFLEFGYPSLYISYHHVGTDFTPPEPVDDLQRGNKLISDTILTSFSKGSQLPLLILLLRLFFSWGVVLLKALPVHFGFVFELFWYCYGLKFSVDFERILSIHSCPISYPTSSEGIQLSRVVL